MSTSYGGGGAQRKTMNHEFLSFLFSLTPQLQSHDTRLYTREMNQSYKRALIEQIDLTPVEKASIYFNYFPPKIGLLLTSPDLFYHKGNRPPRDLQRSLSSIRINAL